MTSLILRLLLSSMTAPLSNKHKLSDVIMSSSASLNSYSPVSMIEISMIYPVSMIEVSDWVLET